MKRCVTAGVALLAAACAGCGTMENFARPEDGGRRPLEVYGGVNRSVNNVKAVIGADLVEAAYVPFLIPFLIPDIAMSAVGDTLTLPLTLPVAGVRAINTGIRDYYFPKEKPPEPPGGRDGRAPGDTPDPLTASGRTVAR